MYSQGFNPHQQMSFAQPLSLGAESLAEYMEMEFAVRVPFDDVVRRLNETLPDGLRVECAGEPPAKSGSAAAILAAAVYDITFPEYIELADSVGGVMAAKEIVVTKKTKSGVGEADVRPDIFAAEVAANGRVRVTVSCGSKRNLKPEIFAALVYEKNGREFEPFKVGYKRLEMLKECADGFCPLLNAQ